MSVGGVIGGAIGFYFGGPSGAALGYSLGSGAEALLNPKEIEGPRLEDLKVQMSSYGAPVPFEWGINRHAGTIIWPKNLELKESSQSESSKGGPETTTYSYSCSVAVLLCEGPIKGVRRVWANKRLVYDASVANTGPTKDPALHGMRVYLGTEDQEVDPLIEATDGPSPAYLGYAYVVFEDFALAEYANRPPQFEFEVVTVGAASQAPPVRLGNGGMTRLYTNPSTEEQTLWSVSGSNVYVYSLPAGELIQTIALPSPGFSITSITGEIWIGHSQSGSDAYGKGATPINPVTYALNASVNFGYIGAISKLGTVVANGLVLYAFINNGVGSGAVMYPTNTASSITVPHYVYFSLEMPTIFKAALAGFGNWVTIANFATDTTAATIYNTDWPSSAQGHRFAHDATRNCLYWANVGSANVYKVDLAVYTLEKIITVTGVQGMHYNTADDTIYVDVGAGLNSYSPVSGAQTGTIAGAGALVAQARGNAIDVGSAEYYYVSEAGSLWKINLKGALAPSKIPLSQIVGDICSRAGLGAADIDVAQLTDLVDGYIVPRQMSGRAAIEPLQQAYYFDAVESDDKLKFVKRGINAPVLIPMEARSAREFGADLPDGLSIIRAQDMELPVQCDVEYPDVDADHLIGNQYDRRITKDTRQRINLQLPIVMAATKAKQIAIVNLYAAWLNETYRFTTTREYAHLEPTDLVTLPTTDAGYTARILSKREQPGGVIEWEARKEGVAVYTQSGAGAAPTNHVSQFIFTPGSTVLELMDLPLLRDQDAGKGFPVAMAGTSSGWPGAQLFKSTDAGSTYGSVFSQAEGAVIGRATTVLGNFAGGDIFDDGNSVTVTIQPGSQLVSYSESQLLNGTSAFALGVNGRWEIAQYKTATLTAPLTYTLTGLLRGRKGTEWAAGSHQINDHFIMLNGGGIQFYDPGVADANIERLYKAPALRASLSSAPPVPFTDTRLRLRPYSVANLRIEDIGNSYLITWAHRSILGGGWRDGGDVPLDATFVAFDVSILKLDGTVVNMYSTAAESFTYSDVDAFNDFGAVPGEFRVRVAQRNSDYGQGVAVTVATNDATLGYSLSPPSTNPGTAPGGSTGGGVGAPIPVTTAAWQFDSYNTFLRAELGSDGAVATLGVYLTAVWASASHVAYFGGLKVRQFNSSNGAYFTEANPDAYVWNRATSTLTKAPLAFVPSGQGYYTGGVLGSQYVVVDGSAGTYSEGAVARRVYRYDFSNPAIPARLDQMTANAFIDSSQPNASINDGLMCNGKIWFPSSGSVWDAATNLWAAMPLPPVDCRYRPLLGAIGSTLYFLGGTTIVREPLRQNNPGPVQNQPEDVPYKNEVWAFDTIAGTWSRKADLPYAVAARMIGSMSISSRTISDPNFDKRLLVSSANGKLYVFDAWGKILQYDPATNAWTTLSNAVSSHFSISNMASDGSSIWIASNLDLATAYGKTKARADLSLPAGLSIDGRLLYRFTPSNL